MKASKSLFLGLALLLATSAFAANKGSLSVQGLWLTYLSGKQSLMQPAWQQLLAWIVDGKLHPVIGHVLPAAQAAEGYELLRARKNFGKVVLKIM